MVRRCDIGRLLCAFLHVASALQIEDTFGTLGSYKNQRATVHVVRFVFLMLMSGF
jgi:hypothetical protein